MIRATIFIVFFTAALILSEESLFDYPDVLDIKGTPTMWEDRTKYCFCDLGAWHGFGLPDKAEYYGGFVGPYEMIWNGWLGEPYIQVVVTDAETNTEINLANVQPDEITLYPGLLKQQFTSNGMTIIIEMWYVSGRSSVVRAVVKNSGGAEKQVKVEWKGQLFTVSQYTYEELSDGVQHEIDDFWIRVLVESSNFSGATGDQHSYRTSSNKTYTITANDSISTYAAVSLCMTQNELNSEKTFLTNSVFSDIEKSYTDNVTRWNGYVTSTLTNAQGQSIVEEELRPTALKCLVTLVTNWRSAAGDFLHDGIYPSHSVSYFNGFWAWDTWKHSFALAPIIPEVAKEGILSMFDYVDSEGMVPDCIYFWKSENNFRNTKPPLTSWAVWEIFKHTGDTNFLEELYPKLKKYHYWWYTFRDNDKTGLCEYGSTDGTLVAAAWESGMDNAVRFDNTTMLNNNNGGWSMNQESVDLNAYLYEEKIFLSNIAEKINQTGDVSQYLTEAETLKQKIQNSFFNSSTGFFHDKKVGSSQFISAKGPEGWTPLFTGCASQEQAEKVKDVMMKNTTFNTYAPFPTCSKDASGFDATAYWRGPIWLDQACFGVMALERYDFKDEAKTLRDKLLNTLEHVKNSDQPVRENYNPLTGDGLNARNFSWSAAHIMMLCREDDGITTVEDDNHSPKTSGSFHWNVKHGLKSIYLQIPENQLSNSTISIVTPKGQVVAKKTISGNSHQKIHVKNLSNGIYFVVIQNSYRKLIQKINIH